MIGNTAEVRLSLRRRDLDREFETLFLHTRLVSIDSLRSVANREW